jgi:chromosomal replication initiator protein
VGEQLWQSVLDRLRARVNPYTLSWLERIAGAAIDGPKLVLQVPDKFARDWIDEHYRALIQAEVSAMVGRPLELGYELSAAPGIAGQGQLKLSERAHAQAAFQATKPAPAVHPRLNERFTFDTFVVASSNQLANAAAEAVANNPGRSYNPLYIHGGTGLGKTHLLHAIGNRVLQRNPNARVAYVSSEEFTNEFIVRVRDNRMHEFRARWREIDVLLLDDVQFLAKKEATQEEFFYTFNALHDAKKAVILTSDMLPVEIAGLEERLKSRFQSGLIADIQAPDLEMRCAILKKKAEHEGVVLPDAVALFIAQRIQRNVRELEGALIKVAAVHSLTRQPITEALAQQTLKDILPAPKPLDVEEIQRQVARYFKVTVDELRQDRRHKQLAYARQVSMYLCRKLTRASFPELGNRFNKDHTTVLAAVRKIDKLRPIDSVLRKQLEELEGQLVVNS